MTEVHRTIPPTLVAAIELAAHAPSIHNSQPWFFVVGQQRIDLYADRERWLKVTDADQRDLLLSCGAALHHLRLGLAAAGIGARVRRLPDQWDPDRIASIELTDQIEAVDHELVEQIPRRRTDRRPFRSYPVPEAFRRRLIDRAAAQGAVLRVIDDPGARQALVGAFAAAGRAQAGLAGYADELATWTRESGGSGIPAANVVRPVPEVVEAARDFGGGPAAATDKAPEEATLVVIGTASDDRLSQLRAGEAMSAVLLEATREGLGTCPLSQPLEIGATRQVIRDRVLAGTLSPQVVLRIGWAPSEPMPPAPRRPVEEIIRSA
ncbi:nitroreductase family protein [Microlunatus sp. Gsoil 973]|uniref:Acg family FMN-binding oxidoreductase n=1 Tax=Microlunatus sp. Gsoil 973 TaxID=2672569 RepID=UPI0012B47CD4|nr:nitroreductase family protein [Microlunatus sp. Gsoil 973]QGN33934.1 NAD(P)H nitroreductase [Microlunatus sp. Gsoil 973]